MTAGSRDDCKATLQGYPDQVLQRHFIKRVREDAARDEKTGESYPGKAVLQYALHPLCVHEILL